jgi:pimeloyl-ACP methyl ester carboxylesterase
MTEVESSGGDIELKEYDVTTNGVSLHVTEHGEGPVVLFCHGFQDTSFTWRRQMKAVASAGYRAIAPDMRGYGRSSAPVDANLYTPLQTTGDLVGLLDALRIPSAVLVGHDWGAAHAWGAGLMRPVGTLQLDNIGHWVQHESSAEVSNQLVKFVRAVKPAG